MQCKTDKSNPLFLFAASAAVFFMCTAAGMIAAFNTEGTLMRSLGGCINDALNNKDDFKQIFTRAASSDFRYTVIVMLLALGKYTSFAPILFIGFKGFSAGYSVILASKAVSAGASAVIALAVFLSCVFTVPIYIVMFLLCRSCAKKISAYKLSTKDKLGEYALFLLSVIILYSLLCLADCIQAAACPLILRLAAI